MIVVEMIEKIIYFAIYTRIKILPCLLSNNFLNFWRLFTIFLHFENILPEEGCQRMKIKKYFPIFSIRTYFKIVRKSGM